MRRHSSQHSGHARPGRRLRPLLAEASLEPRVLLSTGLEGTLSTQATSSRRAAIVAPLARPRRTAGRFVPIHVTPAVVVNTEYFKFAQDFKSVENAYIAAVNSQSSSTVSVSSPLTAPYDGTTPALQVQNGALFGPNGAFSTPITAVASINSVPVATFTVGGRQDNTLLLTLSVPQVNIPAGAIVSATVPSAGTRTGAAALFPAYIANRTGQMAIDLVSSFNQMKLKLPYYNNPPRTPNQRGAIQTFVYNQIVGTQISSLQQSLLLVPLPTSAADLVIYDAAINAAIEQSRTATLNGIRQIYAGKLLISSPTIANRFGVAGGGSAASGGTTGGGTTGGAGAAGGTTGGNTTAG